jgi:hypothetical protein
MGEKMKILHIIILSVMLGFLGFCSRDAVESEYPVVVETFEGVKSYINPEYPRDGRFDFVLTEEFTVGEGLGDEPGVLNQPRDLKVDRSGTLFVLDGGDTNIKVYDAEGRFSHFIGRAGQGPGELGRYIYFAISPEGRVFVMDGMNRRVNQYEKNGNFISDFSIEGFYDKIAVGSGEHIFLSKPVTTPEEVIGKEQVLEQKVTIYRYDLEGNVERTFGEYRGQTTSYTRVDENRSRGGSSPYGYQTVWNICMGDRLLEGYSENYRLTVHSPDGSPEFSFGRQFTPVKYPYFGKGPVNPEFYPAFFRNIIMDDQNNFWLMQTGLDVPEDIKVYDVFSPDGIYIKQVYLTARIYAIQNSRIYSIVRTEDDYLVVKRYSFSAEKRK